ncbi:MAG: hypothetical protein ACOCWR_04270 [Oceanidesulfovibrio sp.]
MFFIAVAGAGGAEANEVQGLRKIVSHGVTGVLVVQSDTGELFVSDVALAITGFIPASTFKMLHALVALGSCIIADTHERIARDGGDRKYAP